MWAVNRAGTLRNPQSVSFWLSLTGKDMYLGSNIFTIDLQVSLTMQQTVHWAIPKEMCNASVFRWCCQNPKHYSNSMLKRYSFPELCIALANAFFRLLTYVEKCIMAHSEILYPITRGECILHNLVPPVSWSVQCPYSMWHPYSHYSLPASAM